MAWKFEGNSPLTVQIADRLRRDIIDGVYPMGSDFPAVRTLAYEAAVNPNTMQKALVILESEGLLITHGTTGRVVTTDAEVISLARVRVREDFVKKTVNEALLLGIEPEQLCEDIRRYCDNQP